MKYLNKLINANDRQDFFSGATNADIETIREFVGSELPVAYIEYLKYMGQYNSLLREERCFVKDIVLNRKHAHQLLKLQNSNYKLKENDFVFWFENQGVAFAFFKITNEENPKVFIYLEDSKGNSPFSLDRSFTDFMLQLLRKETSIFGELSPIIEDDSIDKITLDNNLPF